MAEEGETAAAEPQTQSAEGPQMIYVIPQKRRTPQVQTPSTEEIGPEDKIATAPLSLKQIKQLFEKEEKDPLKPFLDYMPDVKEFYKDNVPTLTGMAMYSAYLALGGPYNFVKNVMPKEYSHINKSFGIGGFIETLRGGRYQERPQTDTGGRPEPAEVMSPADQENIERLYQDLAGSFGEILTKNTAILKDPKTPKDDAATAWNRIHDATLASETLLSRYDADSLGKARDMLRGVSDEGNEIISNFPFAGYMRVKGSEGDSE